MSDILATLNMFAENGIPLFPCNPDKSPMTAHGFKDASTDSAQIRRWHEAHPGCKWGMPTGEIVALDIDAKYLPLAVQLYREACGRAGIGDLLKSLPMQGTPNGGGAHFFFRVRGGDPELRNEKLAINADGKAFIETRATGGYVCVSPSYGYRMQRGEIWDAPTLIPEEVDELFSVARSLTTHAPKVHADPAPRADAGGALSPFDDYNARGEQHLAETLERHGWRHAGGEHWTRPGKDSGVSATLGHEPGVWYCFTSNAAPFEPMQGYSYAHAYALLEHGGDYGAAARQLRLDGYGGERDAGRALEWDDTIGGGDGGEADGDDGGDDEGGDDPDAKIRALLAARAFDLLSPPPEIEPILSLNGTPVLTAGNLLVLSGQAGTAKTHFTAAAIAASLGAQGDCLGWEAGAGDGAILYLDCEQSPQDFHFVLRLGLARGAFTDTPVNLGAWNLTGLGPREVGTVLRKTLEWYKVRFGAIKVVFLDGLADLIETLNDEAEAFKLIREVHALAIEYRCGIVGILHLNPGSDFKTRGHVGSQAERKAETVLQLKRHEDDSITCHTTKARHRAIAPDAGPRFAWDDEAVGFASVECKADAKASAKRVELAKLAVDIFAGKPPSIAYADAVQAVMELTGKAERTAKARLAAIRAEGFAGPCAGTGLWALKDSAHGTAGGILS